MQKIKSNLRHGRGKKNFRCVIGEDRYDGRWLRFKNDGTIEKMDKSTNATVFPSIQAAEKAMEKYEVEDFGLTFFPITTHNGKTRANRMQARERLPQIIIGEIDRETVKQWVWQDPTYSLNDLDIAYVIEHSSELRSEIIAKIGKLIDVHQVADFHYAKAKSSTDENYLASIIEHECKGCNICDEIQEMADFVGLGFDLAFKYRNPAIILADGIIGQMMEKVVLPPFHPRRTEEEIVKECPWATQGKTSNRKPNIITSLELDPAIMEENNLRFQAKYKRIEENEVRYEEYMCDDAEFLLVAFGSSARICLKVVENARKEGLKVGLLRPITLWPFPKLILQKYAGQVKGILSVELNAGQMVEDIRLAVNGKVKVEHFGRLGGIVFTPDEVLEALKNKIIK